MFSAGLFLALGALPAAAERSETPLPWRIGGSLGFAVDAAAFPDPAGSDYVLEVYVRVPPSTLTSLAREGASDSRLALEVRLRNRFGALHHRVRQEFTVVEGDTGGYGKVVILPFPATKSGTYGMEVTLSDLLSRKRGLAYIGRAVPKSASIEGDLVVPAAWGGARVSDLEFLWPGPGARNRAFRHGEADSGSLPNPDRLYGLLAAELRSQFVIQPPPGARLPWRWRARLVEPTGGRLVAVRESTAAGTPASGLVTVDLSTEPAGAYDLLVDVWAEGSRDTLRRTGRLSVAWQAGSWRRNPRDIEDEVHLLLDRQQDEDSFERLSAGEQERYLDDFWRVRDPSPATAVNEARVEFAKRVEYANRTWTRAGMGKGMFTDMGRAFIRHGEPSEILRQVLPAGDQTLAQLLQELDISEDRPTGEVRSKGLGGDMRPFEVWIYEGERDRGLTAAPDPRASASTRKRLLFLFVDERGIGDYRLRYTTE